MRKLAKYVVLVAGMVGVVGFFFPFFTLTYDGHRADFSADSLVTGIDDIADHAPTLRNLDPVAAQNLNSGLATFNEDLKPVRPLFVVVFIPSVLLVALGVLGLALGRFGRGLATIAVLCGIAALAIYLLLGGLSCEFSQGKGGLGLGARLVAVSGAIGVVAGLFALFKPERGYRRRGKRFKATIASSGVPRDS